MSIYCYERGELAASFSLALLLSSYHTLHSLSLSRSLSVSCHVNMIFSRWTAGDNVPGGVKPQRREELGAKVQMARGKRER